MAKYSVKVSSQEEADVLVKAYKKYLPGEVVGCIQYDPEYRCVINYYEPNNPKEINQDRYCLQLLSYNCNVAEHMTSEELIKYLTNLAKTRLINSFTNLRGKYIVFENETQYKKIKSLVGDDYKILDRGDYAFRIFGDKSGSFRSRNSVDLSDEKITFDEMVNILKLLFDIPDEKEVEMQNDVIGYAVKMDSQGQLDTLRTLCNANGFKAFDADDVKTFNDSLPYFIACSDKEYDLDSHLVVLIPEIAGCYEVALEELIKFITTGAVPNTDIEINDVKVEVNPGDNITFGGELFTKIVVDGLISMWNYTQPLGSKITNLSVNYKFNIGKFVCSMIPGKEIVIGCTTFEKSVVERIIAKWNS